jgi:tRNA pseudouridine38-40 synthase
MRNIKLTVAYDGSEYFGWQKQVNKRTVWEELYKAINKICKLEGKLISASRTDAKAHALGQVVNFKTDSQIPTDAFPKALNQILPNDIVVYRAEEVDLEFHSRFSAKSRTYRYIILNSPFPSPHHRNYVLWFPYELKIEKMQEAAKDLIGIHNFSYFASLSKVGKRNPSRQIIEVEIERERNFINIDICGDSFLPGMIRSIVGILLKIGSNKFPQDSIKRILNGDTSVMIPKASAKGLYLLEVKY